MKERVARIRELLGEAVARKHAELNYVEGQRVRRHPRLLRQGGVLSDRLDKTPRARAIQEIRQIALEHDCGHEIEAALDAAAVSSMGFLHDAAVYALQARLTALRDTRATGLESLLDNACDATQPAKIVR